MTASYSYGMGTGRNGVILHWIKTSPKNIILKSINATIPGMAAYGLNGGFFYKGDILSIAVNNDLPVKGRRGDYGVGWYHEGNYHRGTLVWDNQTRQFSVPFVKNDFVYDKVV